jgi:hypothetical protein
MWKGSLHLWKGVDKSKVLVDPALETCNSNGCYKLSVRVE